MASTKQKPLTDAQKRALKWLTRTYQFPRTMRRTCEALQDKGFAESELRMIRRDYSKRTADFTRAYRLTDADAALRKTLQEETTK